MGLLQRLLRREGITLNSKSPSKKNNKCPFEFPSFAEVLEEAKHDYRFNDMDWFGWMEIIFDEDERAKADPKEIEEAEHQLKIMQEDYEDAVGWIKGTCKEKTIFRQMNVDDPDEWAREIVDDYESGQTVNPGKYWSMSSYGGEIACPDANLDIVAELNPEDIDPVGTILNYLYMRDEKEVAFREGAEASIVEIGGVPLVGKDGKRIKIPFPI